MSKIKLWPCGTEIGKLKPGVPVWVKGVIGGNEWLSHGEIRVNFYKGLFGLWLSPMDVKPRREKKDRRN